MPELPEVETIARGLRQGGRGEPPALGEQVRSVALLWGRTLAEPGAEAFAAALPGKRIRAVGRRGKYLVIDLEGGPAADPAYLLFHLRMSGDLRVESQEQPIRPHDRLLLQFESGLRLAFNDARKFGRAWLVADPRQVTGALGPEPLDADFTPERFTEMLAGRTRRIKPLLLDQTFLAGMGNIYTDEALFLAKLHPLTLASSLNKAQATGLHAAIQQVLNWGIRSHGASIDWVYRGGEFQNNFQVYGRTGQPCRVCGTPVARTVVGQRGTHYCPVCQPER